MAKHVMTSQSGSVVATIDIVGIDCGLGSRGGPKIENPRWRLKRAKKNAGKLITITKPLFIIATRSSLDVLGVLLLLFLLYFSFGDF